MSEVIVSKAFNGRTNKQYSPEETREEPLAWWAEARPEENGQYRLIKVNHDFDSASRTEQLFHDRAPNLVSEEEAKRQLSSYEETYRLHGYDEMKLPEEVLKPQDFAHTG